MNSHDTAPDPDLDTSTDAGDSPDIGDDGHGIGDDHATDTDHEDGDVESITDGSTQSPEVTRRISNYSIRGQLTAHYSSRDVVYDLDGCSALTIMSNWQRRPVYQTEMNPSRSSAAMAWIGLDLAEVVGFTWRPHRPDVDSGSEDRWAFDPIV